MVRKGVGQSAKLVVVLLGSSLLTGCACGMLSPCGVEPCPEPEPEVVAEPEPPPPPPPPPPPQPPAAKIVYFDFDEAVVRGEDMPLLERHAEFLRDHPQRNIVVEGHCDERGPERYNNGLGLRRAEAVREVLRRHGIAEDRIESKSFGESRPAVPGSDESAWASNRRAVIIYYE